MRIGIDLGGSHVGVGIVNEKGQIVAKIEEDIKLTKPDEIEKDIEKKIINNINTLLNKEKINISDIEMIGIACPGAVSGGTLLSAGNLGIENFPIGEIVNQYFKVPVYLKNDAKCAAIAEKNYGCLAPYQDTIFLTIGTGIGGALFYQNKLVQSQISETFEVGHMVIQKNGKQCKCGKKGCFEQYASMRALKNKVKKEYEIEDHITGLELYQYITKYQSETKMKQIIEEYIQDLSIGLANIITIYKVEAIGFGGSFAYYEDLFLDKLQQKIKELTFGGYIPKLEIAQMKNDAGMIGASRINYLEKEGI